MSNIKDILKAITDAVESNEVDVKIVGAERKKRKYSIVNSGDFDGKIDTELINDPKIKKSVDMVLWILERYPGDIEGMADNVHERRNCECEGCAAVLKWMEHVLAYIVNEYHKQIEEVSSIGSKEGQ